MPRKTAGESIQDIVVDLRGLNERYEALKATVGEADLRAVRERLAVRESQVAELRKVKDDGDRWFKQLLLIAVGAALTLVANVLVDVVLFAKK